MKTNSLKLIILFKNGFIHITGTSKYSAKDLQALGEYYSPQAGIQREFRSTPDCNSGKKNNLSSRIKENGAKYEVH
jgi:hypothetical protein